MTTEDDAWAAVGLLVGSIPGFNEDAAKTFAAQFLKHTEHGAALREVCERMALTWDGKMRPSLGEVLDEYRRHPDVVAEREARVAAAMLATMASATHCDGGRWIPIPGDPDNRRRPCPRCNPYWSDIYDDPPRWTRAMNGTPLHELHDGVTLTRNEMKGDRPDPPPCKIDTRYEPPAKVDFAEGQAIIGDEYRTVYGSEMGTPAVANPAWAITLIENDEHYDVGRNVWYSTYANVLEGFRGVHAAAQASLKAIGPRRLTWDGRGQLTLKPPPEMPERTWEPRTPSPAPASAAQPPPTAERPPDASGLLSEALGITRSRMEDP